MSVVGWRHGFAVQSRARIYVSYQREEEAPGVSLLPSPAPYKASADTKTKPADEKPSLLLLPFFSAAGKHCAACFPMTSCPKLSLSLSQLFSKSKADGKAIPG